MKTGSNDVSPFALSVELADGGTLDLQGLAGKPLLVVNTATRCGLAPQFESLEQLHRDYGSRGLTVLGIPSNQFANQEPEADQDMTAACRRDHGVTFTLARKTMVNGPETHPVMARLKSMAPGFLGKEEIRWNFTKFLVWPDGKRVRRYAPTTPPDRIRRDIEGLLG
jgi:glutathione peroxidase